MKAKAVCLDQDGYTTASYQPGLDVITILHTNRSASGCGEIVLDAERAKNLITFLREVYGEEI